VEVLSRYLRSLVAQRRANGMATTFVLVDPDQPDWILAYYTLSAATRSLETLTKADREGLPAYPIPAVRVRRLAGAASARRQGIGELLLRNAIERILQVRGTLGVFAVVFEATNAATEAFYRKYRFCLCDADTRQLYLPLGEG